MALYVILGVLGGIFAVDDRAGWQSLMAQPIFLGVTVGLVTGELFAGMAVGLALELIWLSILPMRGAKKPDHVVGTIVGAGTACILITQTGIADLNFLSILDYRILSSGDIDPRFILFISLGAFLGLLAAGTGLSLLSPFYELRERKLGDISLASDKLSPARINMIHLGSIVFIFLIESIVTFLLLLLAIQIAKLAVSWNNRALIKAAIYWYSLIPVMGAAALIQIYWHRQAVRFLLLSLAITLAIYIIK